LKRARNKGRKAALLREKKINATSREIRIKMAIEITSDKKNVILSRRELEFILPGKLTPSRKETKTELAKKLNVHENLIVIDKIEQRTGSQLTLGTAKVYSSEEQMKRLSLEHKNTRGVKKAAEGEAAPASTEAKPAEKPAEKKA